MATTNDQFPDNLQFRNFLYVIITHYANELKGYDSPADIKKLANKEKILPFNDLLVDENFVTKWYQLYYWLKKQPACSMYDEAIKIQSDLKEKGNTVQYFADFPKRQGNQLEDWERYHEALCVFRNKFQKKNDPDKVDPSSQYQHINNQIQLAKAKLEMGDDIKPLDSGIFNGHYRLRAKQFFAMADQSNDNRELDKQFSDLPPAQRKWFDNLEENQAQLYTWMSFRYL